jgi:DNA polymerase III alpha subunit
MEKLKQIISQRSELYPELKSSPNFEKRLRWELIEIDVQDMESYFLDLYEKGQKSETNENNLLVCRLLGICDQVDLEKEPKTKTGEFPDVDVDYLPIVRDYLKTTWAPKVFGETRVCNIGNYGTFGLKSTLIDMARVHGLDRQEVLQITTELKLKDDEGQALTYDKALELYPKLKAYCEAHPDVAQATQKLLHRNRSMGKHAGGLILCNQDIDKFVPLVKGTDGEAVSAWVEGLHGQDLGPVGLIKFDLLVVNGLWQIALTVKLVKERHNIKNISAYPGEWDWSDTSYLNDPLSIQTANAGDLKCIFQYDSDGIRKLVTKGGVDSFDDLVAYVSIYRPSALDIGADVEYVERKKGIKPFEIPEVLQKVLGETYGIFIYQEQIMQVLSIVGKIPLRDCYQVIKAISKKKISAFQKYKDKFVENGQIVLGKSKEELEQYWATVESWAGYGFNASHATCYSYISARQLYLKVHYPIEFYAATLMCDSADEKLREYITEAENHGVTVCGLDINKSKVNFAIVDEKIYIGFSNIKGIGEEKAKRIVEMQPYVGFEDFVERFGTEAAVLKALIPLGVFDEAEPERLYKFWIAYAESQKQINEKRKRHIVSLAKMLEDFKSAMPPAFSIVENLSEKVFDFLKDYVNKKDIDNKIHILDTIEKFEKKYKTSITRFHEKAAMKPTLESFDPSSVKIEDPKIVQLLRNKRLAQETFYGYVWDNRVKFIKDYKQKKNFANVRSAAEAGAPWVTLLCEVLEVNKKSFKNGKGQFASVLVMDDNFETGRITVWEEDYERFKAELKKGNLISIQVCPPSNGFPTYTFKSPPKHKRHELPKDKKNDYRIVLFEMGE